VSQPLGGGSPGTNNIGLCLALTMGGLPFDGGPSRLIKMYSLTLFVHGESPFGGAWQRNYLFYELLNSELGNIGQLSWNPSPDGIKIFL